jgi:hypothetical protein
MSSKARSGASTDGSAAQGSPSQGTQQSQRSTQHGGNHGRFKAQAQQQQQPPAKKFTGKEEGLGDEFIYQFTDGWEATDQYARMTKEIVRYVSTKYKHGADVEISLVDGAKLIINMPPPPVEVGTPPSVPETNMIVWEMRVQLSSQRTSLLDSNLESAYALIKGQCSKPIFGEGPGSTELFDSSPGEGPCRIVGADQGSDVQLQLQEVPGYDYHRHHTAQQGVADALHVGLRVP